jgi:hypothetical protein
LEVKFLSCSNSHQITRIHRRLFDGVLEKSTFGVGHENSIVIYVIFHQMFDICQAKVIFVTRTAVSNHV